MNYRTISDLNDAITSGFARLPSDIDLVVGVPRSGLLAANLYALVANVAFVDLDGFLAGRVLATGRSRPLRPDRGTSDNDALQRVLVIDDSINSGAAMREARARIAASGIDLSGCTFCAVYGADRHHPDVDIVLERVRRPRVFQWNLFHHKHLAHSCVDLEGVLRSPRTGVTEDRPALGSAPAHLPSAVIGSIVTTRPESEREATEAWLAEHAIRYQTLHMRPAGAACATAEDLTAYRVRVYRGTRAVLFVSGDPHAAPGIAASSGKPVLCLQTQAVHTGRSLDPVAAVRRLRNLPLRLRLATGEGRPWRDLVRANVDPHVLSRFKRSIDLLKGAPGLTSSAGGKSPRAMEEHGT